MKAAPAMHFCREVSDLSDLSDYFPYVLWHHLFSRV